MDSVSATISIIEISLLIFIAYPPFKILFYHRINILLGYVNNYILYKFIFQPPFTRLALLDEEDS